MRRLREINSSDQEFDDVPVVAHDRLRGQASIAKMKETAEQDRMSSKRTVKGLQLQSLVPSTEKKMSLWVQRFEAFREFVLQQSIHTPFTGDDLIRFFDVIISAYLPCMFQTLTLTSTNR